MGEQLYIDIHVIQTIPPSCVNRDDTGTPKTAVYGGVQRARVSSQAWKHEMRKYFREKLALEIGARTRYVEKMIEDEIIKKDPSFTEEKAREMAKDAIEEKIGITTKGDENAALLFISPAQAKAIAELEISKDKNKDSYKKALKENPTIDIALFGRMLANDPSLKYDAAAQVAHAISTHEARTEYDYFTAIDDLKAEDKSGAAHLDTTEFNSSTMYRYATINVEELERSMGEKTPEAVRSFIEAFVCAMPTGKQNSFANRTVPDLLYITVRNDQPVNLAAAFEKPVKASPEGYIDESSKSLLNYAEKIYNSFVDKPVLMLGSGDEKLLEGHAETVKFKSLLDKVAEFVRNSKFEEERS